jgi:DNA-binding SARP family transcriptional activator
MTTPVGGALRFGILGSLTVTADGRDVPINGLRRKALLARLLLDCGRVVPTERIVEDLWAGVLPSGPTVGLKSHIYQLRRALGVDELVVARSGGYVLRADPGQVDAFEFERLLGDARSTWARGDLEVAGDRFDAALALFRGPPLADIADLDFAVHEADRLEQLRLAASEDRFDIALQLGRHAAVVGELEDLADAYPLRERLIGQLMLSLYRCGRQADALGVYRTTRGQLLEQLGIDPSPELQALERAILIQATELDGPLSSAGARPPDPSPRPVAPASPDVHEREGSIPAETSAPSTDLRRRAPLPLPLAATSELPFVGREAELAELAALWEVAAGGSRRAVIISGEPGIGKTRQAAELARFVADHGGNVLYGACDEDLRVPYQPFAEALRHHLRQVGFRLPAVGHGLDGELARLMPELPKLVSGLAPPTNTDPATQRHLLFEAVVATLAAIASDTPALLVLEDIQWATKPTLLMLRHLLGSPQPAPLLVVATHRDTGSSTTPAAEVISTLTKLPGVRRLTLRPLRRGEARSLLGSMHEQPLESQHRDRLLDDAQGNPFFLTELSRHLAEAGTAADPVTPASRAEPAEMPVGIRDLIDRRVALLTGAPEVLTAAAVLGRTFDLRTLAHIVGPSTCPDAVATAIDEAVDAGMLRTEGPGWFAFAHDLVRQHLCARTGPAGRVHLHRRVGEAVEALANPDDHLETLAHHFTEAAPAGGATKALLYSMAAAERALSQAAFEEGAVQIRRALEATRSDPSVPPELMAEAYECLALTTMPTPTGDFAAHRAACLEAADWARRAGSAEALAIAAIEAMSRTQPDVRESEVEALGAEALAQRDALPAGLGALLLATSVLYRSTAEDYGERLERDSQEALEVARASGAPEALHAAFTARYWSIFPTPKVQERFALAEEQLRLPGASDVRPRAARMHRTLRIPAAQSFRGIASLEMGDRDAFEADLEVLAGTRDTTGMAKARSTLWRGMVLLMDGRFDEAGTFASEMLKKDLESNYTGSYIGQLFQVKFEQGRLDEVLPLLTDAIEQGRLSGTMHASAALAYQQAGDEVTARSLLASLAHDDFAGLPRNITWVAGYANATEATAGFGEPDWAGSLYRYLAPFAGLTVVIAWGVACKGSYDRLLGMLAATVGDAERARSHYEAALLLEERLRMPAALARTRYWFGRLLLDGRSAQDQSQAQAMLRAARETGRALGMARLVEDIDHLVAGRDHRLGHSR